MFFFFFKQKTAYEMRISDWSSDVCSSDLQIGRVLDEIERAGELDNTLVLFVEGDNGSSAEGGANGLFNETAGLNEAGEADYPVALANIDRFGGPMTYGHFSSAERRVGEECVGTCKSRRSPSHSKKQTKNE